MPVDITSRYRGLPVQNAPDRNGVMRPTIGLRLLDELTPATFRHRLVTLETIESISFLQFSNSTYWWRIADANPRVFPLDWNPNDAMALPSTSDVTRIQRSRSF